VLLRRKYLLKDWMFTQKFRLKQNVPTCIFVESGKELNQDHFKCNIDASFWTQLKRVGII